MKKSNPVFIVLGFVFFILSVTTKNYFYLFPAVLFILAGLIKNNKKGLKAFNFHNGGDEDIEILSKNNHLSASTSLSNY